MIKNLTLFDVSDPAILTDVLTGDQAMPAFLAKRTPDDLEERQQAAAGFAPATIVDSDYAVEIDDLIVFRFKTLERKLPAAAVKREVEREIEKAASMAPGGVVERSVKREIKENVVFRMLPGAPIVDKSIPVFFDRKTNMLAVQATSDKEVSNVMTAVHELAVEQSVDVSFRRWVPGDASADRVMTRMVTDDDVLPDGWDFTGYVKMLNGQNKTATFQNDASLVETVTTHRNEEGMTVTELGLTVPDQVSFKLDEKLVLKAIKFGPETEARLSEAEDESKQALMHGSILIEFDTLRPVLRALADLFGVGSESGEAGRQAA